MGELIADNLHPWLVIFTTCGIFTTLVISRRIPLDLLFLIGLVIVTLGGAISPAEAFAGFSNPAVLTIGVILCLTAGLKKCGVIHWLGTRLLGNVTSERSAVRRIGAALLGASPFLLNTALVAMFIPIVLDWCHRHKVAPSKLLIPVSYLSILGGVCTLIGTSTTLVVQAQLTQIAKTDPNILPLGFFELTSIGLPCALVGAVFMFSIGTRLLPDRREIKDQLDEDRREYLAEVLVREHCDLVGKEIEAAGLRHLKGLFLIEIDRGDEVITPVSPREKILAGDRLLFTGDIETINEVTGIDGLELSDEVEYEFDRVANQKKRLTEVVLSGSSPLIGRTLRGADFRRLYSAAVIAIHRSGERIKGKIGDIILVPGDTLLIQSKNRFAESLRTTRDFLMVIDLSIDKPPTSRKSILAAGIFAGLVIWLAAGALLGGGNTWASPPLAAFSALVAMVGCRCITFSDARNSIEIQMLLTIAFALGLGEAMSTSGAATKLASLCTVFADHPFLALAVVYFVTMLLTEMISNTAVAAIMIPTAISIAAAVGIDARPFILAVTIAASLSFITPIGYQTNLMVMGPGGYRPTDYLRCGIPLGLLMAVTTLAVLKFKYAL